MVIVLNVLGLWALLLLVWTARVHGAEGLRTLGALTRFALSGLGLPVALIVLAALASRALLGWP